MSYVPPSRLRRVQMLNNKPPRNDPYRRVVTGYPSTQNSAVESRTSIVTEEQTNAALHASANGPPEFPPPPISAIHSPLITVGVGQPANHYSSYFRGILNSGFQEAFERKVALDDDLVVFETFLYVIYSGGKLYEAKPLASINPDSDKPDDCTEVALSMDRLIRIWIFGDKRGIPFLQDLALYAMHKRSTQTKRVASGSLIKHILEHTTTQSALRRFHTDLLVACASASHVQKTLEKLKDVSFTTDLCLKMMEYREKEPVWNCWREWAAVDLAQYYVRGERTASGVRIVEEQNTKHGGVVYIDR